MSEPANTTIQSLTALLQTDKIPESTAAFGDHAKQVPAFTLCELPMPSNQTAQLLHSIPEVCKQVQ